MRQEMNKITLQELGSQLPIGFENGQLHREFTLKPYRMKEERLIGQIYEKKQNVSMGKFVTSVLSIMIKSLGSLNFEQMNAGERKLILSRMYVGDVIYLYVWLRLEALGNELKINLNCNHCREAFDFVADLNTIEIKTVNTPNELDTKIKLKKGLEINDQIYKDLHLKPSTWNVMENLGNGAISNPGKMKAQMFKSCIKDVEGIDDFVITDHVIDEMYKIDIELLVRKIDDIHPGPVMIIEDDCPKCGQVFTAPIDWSHDNFFGASSM